MKLLFCILPPAAPDYPLLGPALLAGAVKRLGHQFILFDANIHLYEQLKNEQWRWSGEGWESWTILHESTDIAQLIATWVIGQIHAHDHVDALGLSVTSAGRLLTQTVISLVRASFPKLPIFLGGPAFFNAADISSFQIPQAVYICKGEGEITLQNWLQASCFTSALFKNEYNPIDLNDLPLPDFSVYTQVNYTRLGVLPFETSRGCCNRCSFCDDAQMWGKIRLKTPERIHWEFSQLPASVKHISFCDSVLNPTHKRGMDLAAIVKNYPLTWDGMLQCKNVDKKLASALFTSGCTHAFLGVESFDDAFLKLLNKPSKGSEAVQAIRDLSQAGINVSIGFIIAGPPLQTRIQFESDLHQLKSILPYCYSVAVNPLFIPEGTPLWTKRNQLGVSWSRDDNWGFWHGANGAQDFETRMNWCLEARSLLTAYPNKTNISYKEAKTQIETLINKAKSVDRKAILASSKR